MQFKKTPVPEHLTNRDSEVRSVWVLQNSLVPSYRTKIPTVTVYVLRILGKSSSLITCPPTLTTKFLDSTDPVKPWNE